MGYRVLAIGLSPFSRTTFFLTAGLDSEKEKKELCLKIGAEKWLDFMESTDIIKDVKTATDGMGPHSAIITVGDVSTFQNRKPWS